MAARIPITVGLPVYNREPYIRTALDSLVGQTFTDFELVICDNASTDATPMICQEYAARDPRIRYYRNTENVGANRNFNRVFELARGEYLKWCTSDDCWAPEMLEKTYPIIEGDPSIVLCYPKTMICDADGVPREPYEDNLHLMEDNPADRFINLLARIGLCHQHLGLIRRDALARTALLGDHIACDTNLLAELSLYGKFYEYPERLFFRRLHPGSSSWKKNWQKDKDAEEHQLDFTDPRRVLGVRYHLWRRHLAFLSAVHRAPLTGRDRRRLYAFLARGMVWDRGPLAAELVSGVRQRLRRDRPRPVRNTRPASPSTAHRPTGA
jgi:glycosyltransferase involved in cell wall biosynthesis